MCQHTVRPNTVIFALAVQVLATKICSSCYVRLSVTLPWRLQVVSSNRACVFRNRRNFASSFGERRTRTVTLYLMAEGHLRRSLRRAHLAKPVSGLFGTFSSIMKAFAAALPVRSWRPRGPTLRAPWIAIRSTMAAVDNLFFTRMWFFFSMQRRKLIRNIFPDMYLAARTRNRI